MLLAYLKLLRFPNIFSAFANILAGWLIVHVTWRHDKSTSQEWLQLGLLLASSGCLYLAGLVLNDVFDYQIDQQERPERPLPAGQIPMVTAKRLGWGLLVMGLLLALIVSWQAEQAFTVATAAVLALAIISYNQGLKSTPLGPVVMGTCRWLNWLLGMSVGPSPWSTWQLLIAAAVGVYIAGVTIFARGEAGQSSRPRLIVGWLVIVVGLAMIWGLPRYAPGFPEPAAKVLTQDWTLMWLALLVLFSVRCVWAIMEPTSERVQQAVTQCLRSLIILDAIICYSVCDLYGALVVLCLMLPQTMLGRLIYAT